LKKYFLFVEHDDGSANLFIGTGQSLVIGGVASQLEAQKNRFNVQDLDVIMTQGGSEIDITSSITGGELQGVIDFKNNVLEPSRRSLGRIAIAMTEEINAQHRLGMTLQSNTAPFPLGQDFFTSLTNSPQVLEGQVGSTGSYTSAITDSRILTTSDYRLDITGGGANYTLTRLSDEGIVYNGNDVLDLNTAAETQGFSITQGAGPVANESFLIRPTATASSSLDMFVNNVLDIALASPLVSGAASGVDGGALNSGTGEITLPTNGSIAGIPLAADISLTFDAANGDGAGGPGFVVGGGPVLNLAYDPATEFGGKTFNFPTVADMTFTMSGQPIHDDVFVISNNEAPFDDNRNGLLMIQLQTTDLMENSSANFQSAYSIIVSDVGTKTHSSEIDLLAQQILSEQANAERDSYSGVNLDEEAADLLKYQQAYQASARVISAADEMFNALLNAV